MTHFLNTLFNIHKLTKLKQIIADTFTLFFCFVDFIITFFNILKTLYKQYFKDIKIYFYCILRQLFTMQSSYSNKQILNIIFINQIMMITLASHCFNIYMFKNNTLRSESEYG